LEVRVPKIDIAATPPRQGSSYPAPFAEMAKDRTKQALGNAGGLSDFGVNLVTLPVGAWSSQRHWHLLEDEFVYVLSGELTLVTDAGETRLGTGECAAFPKNTPDGHHFINKSTSDAVYLEIGARSGRDTISYPDIDLHLVVAEGGWRHKDGTPYPLIG
jgi:uncharacterized cupin superfamily protein